MRRFITLALGYLVAACGSGRGHALLRRASLGVGLLQTTVKFTPPLTETTRVLSAVGPFSRAYEWACDVN
jgi:hypothetical protein